ncbi:MAG TPA: hypothetical protein VJL32_02745 [Candidatus Paceibacterota bacterium]
MIIIRHQEPSALPHPSGGKRTNSLGEWTMRHNLTGGRLGKAARNLFRFGYRIVGRTRSGLLRFGKWALGEYLVRYTSPDGRHRIQIYQPA